MRINSISFCAKKPIIRDLDDKNRKLRQDFSDTKSSTKLMVSIEKRNQSVFDEKNEPYLNLIHKWDLTIGDIRNIKQRTAQTIEQEVKKGKVANCEELCKILAKRLELEGYKTFFGTFDVNPKKESRKMDNHFYLILNPSKSIQEKISKNQGEKEIDLTQKDFSSSTIIVDPFFAFVKYAPEALETFSRELNLGEEEKLTFKLQV